MPISVPFIDPTWGVKGGDKASDVLVKDKQQHLSAILEATGWGPKNGQTQKIARGIVAAESGGDPEIFNGSCCYGLFQVNLVWKGDCGIPKSESDAIKWLKDPYNNSKAAHCIYKKQGWTAWETYTNGSYRTHPGFDPLIKSKQNLATVVESAVGDNPISVLSRLIKALFDPSTYFRIGKGLLGGVILIIGTATIIVMAINKASRSPAGQTIKKGVETAATVAAV